MEIKNVFSVSDMLTWLKFNAFILAFPRETTAGKDTNVSTRMCQLEFLATSTSIQETDPTSLE